MGGDARVGGVHTAPQLVAVSVLLVLLVPPWPPPLQWGWIGDPRTPGREWGGLSSVWRMSVPKPSVGGVSSGRCEQGDSGAANTDTKRPLAATGTQGSFPLALGGRVGRDPQSSTPVPATQSMGLSTQPYSGSLTPLPPCETKGRGRSPLQRETEAQAGAWRVVPRCCPLSGSEPRAASAPQDTGDHPVQCCPPAPQSSELLLEGLRQPGLFLGAP